MSAAIATTRPVRTCLTCGGDMSATRTELRYETDDVLIIVQNVPASRCIVCDEQYVPGPIGVLIGEKVQEVAQKQRAEADSAVRTRSVTLRTSERLGGLVFA